MLSLSKSSKRFALLRSNIYNEKMHNIIDYCLTFTYLVGILDKSSFKGITLYFSIVSIDHKTKKNTQHPCNKNGYGIQINCSERKGGFSNILQVYQLLDNDSEYCDRCRCIYSG